MADKKDFATELSDILSQDKKIAAELQDNKENPENIFLLSLIKGERSLADLSVEELEKLSGIVNNLSVKDELKASRDAVIGQIKSRQEELAKNAILNDPFLGKTSYDLWVIHKNALSSPEPKNQELAKKIHDYAIQYLKNCKLTADNAPVVADFYAIDDNSWLQQMSKEGKSPDIISNAYSKRVKARNDAIHLDEKLAEYDDKNGLKDLKLTAEQYKQNENIWSDLVSQNQEDLLAAYMKKFPALAAIPTDSKLYKETYEALQTAAMNQLSLQEPNSELAKTQPHKALSPYEEKIYELTEQYQIIFDTQRNAIIADDATGKKEILRAFLKSYKDIAGNTIDEEQWQKMMNGLNKEADNGDENAKNELDKIHRSYQQFAYKYMDEHADKYYPNIYNTINCEIASSNAVLAGRIARKTNMSQTPRRSAELYSSFAENHPLIIGGGKKLLQNGAWSLGVIAALGPLGMTIRSVWKTAGTYKKIYAEYKKNKEQYKNFAQYLWKNKAAMRELATQAALTTVSVGFTAALALSGGLGFGLAGSALGMGGVANLAATAGQATLLGFSKMKIMGAITAISSAISYVSARHKLAPKNKELLEILHKYDNSIQVKDATRLFNYKAWFTKNKEENILKELTNTWSNLRKEDEFFAKLQKIAPNMSKEDQQKVLAVAKQIQQIKAESYGAAIGGAIGGAMAGGGIHTVEASTTTPHIDIEHTNPEDSEFAKYVNTNEIKSSSNLLGEDAPTEETPAAGETSSTTQTTPEQEQAQEPEIVIEHALSKEEAQHFSKLGPTPIVEKLQQMGVLSDEDKATMLKENGHALNSSDTLPSRVVAAYLGHSYDDTETSVHANLTPEQEKELNDFLHSDEYKARCDELNSHHGHSAENTVSATKETSTTQQENATTKDISNSDATSETKTEAEAEKKSDEQNKVEDKTAEKATENKPAENTEKQHSESQKVKDIEINNVKNIHQEKIVIYDKGTETAKAYMINTTDKTTDEQRVAMAMKLYHDEHPEAKKVKLDIYGRDGKMEAEIKEKNVVLKNGTTEKDISRTIENERGKVSAKVEQHTFKDGTKVQEVKYTDKMVAGSAVGAENGEKPDKLIGRTTIIDEKGNKTVVITAKDGDTGNKITRGPSRLSVNNKEDYHDLATRAIKEAKQRNK